MTGRKLSFHLQFVSKKNGQGAACEILIPLNRAGMLKVGSIERHMVADPQGKNTGFTSPQTTEGWCSEEAQGRERRKEIKLLGGGFSGAHESAFAKEQYLNSPDFVLRKLLFQIVNIHSVCLSVTNRGCKRKMPFHTYPPQSLTVLLTIGAVVEVYFIQFELSNSAYAEFQWTATIRCIWHAAPRHDASEVSRLQLTDKQY